MSVVERLPVQEKTYFEYSSVAVLDGAHEEAEDVLDALSAALVLGFSHSGAQLLQESLLGGDDLVVRHVDGDVVIAVVKEVDVVRVDGCERRVGDVAGQEKRRVEGGG